MIDRLWRAFWSVVFHFELRAKGVRSASFVTLRGKRPLIRNEGSMRLGKNFRAHGRVIRSQFATIGSGSLVFGDDVGLNEGVSISAQRSVTIGDNVFIADHVSIHDSDYHEVEPGAGVSTAPVRIERNAWIGRNAIVLRGVTIGANAVVASGAIVTKDVPAATIVAGNPARVIRELTIPNPGTYVRPR